MATKIRLQRNGRKGYAFYSIVIADARAPRDGRFTEKIGGFKFAYYKYPYSCFLDSANAYNPYSLNSSHLTIRKRIRDARVCGQKNIAQVLFPFFSKPSRQLADNRQTVNCLFVRIL